MVLTPKAEAQSEASVVSEEGDLLEVSKRGKVRKRTPFQETVARALADAGAAAEEPVHDSDDDDDTCIEKPMR